MQQEPNALNPEEMTRPAQVVLPSTIDHFLQPDAMRGSEHFFRLVKDGDGNPIPTNDIEEQRREFHRKAQGMTVRTEAREPQQIRVTAPDTSVADPAQRQYLAPSQVNPPPESLTPPPAPRSAEYPPGSYPAYSAAERPTEAAQEPPTSPEDTANPVSETPGEPETAA